MSRQPRQPDFPWFSLREAAAILPDMQRLLRFGAELHSMVSLQLPCPGDMQQGADSCSTAFLRQGAGMWVLGASPTAGWARSRTPAYTSAGQREDLGAYVVAHRKTLTITKVCVFTTAFPPVKAMRGSLPST